MAATIRDVAQVTGVHISTVSRSFSAPHLVNEATRGRVLAAAARLGYRPNRAARALTTGRTYNIGLIVANIANPYFPPLIKAAQAHARERDYHVFVADTDEDPAVEEELVHALAKQVDGVVLASPRVGNRLIEQLARSVTLVLVNRRVEGLPAVLMDMRGGTRQVIEHLARLGHTRLAFAGGPPGAWTNREMRRAAAASARAMGLTLEVLGPHHPTENGGAAAAEEVVRTGATGVTCYNDLMALGLAERLGELGVRVPEDVSVVGVDDISPSRHTRPKLTTLAMPTAAAGRLAVDMLLQLAGDPDASNATATLDVALVVRDSTGPARRS
ncbi:MAG: LacI family DNA-binding transcriptional regulator [Streptosporangiales bacterium]|nr:LacI family DNA-binding transcriptional regulator [Streptosporangiales bacterium]